MSPRYYSLVMVAVLHFTVLNIMLAKKALVAIFTDWCDWNSNSFLSVIFVGSFPDHQSVPRFLLGYTEVQYVLVVVVLQTLKVF